MAIPHARSSRKSRFRWNLWAVSVFGSVVTRAIAAPGYWGFPSAAYLGPQEKELGRRAELFLLRDGETSAGTAPAFSLAPVGI
jgi:hypothetical protein